MSLDERDATIERVRTLAATWADGGERLNALAAIRSAEGDDSLTRALAVGRAYAAALTVALAAS